ncbi:MAG: mechanosensitive ion channel family protein [Saprospiraceae bacterium]|nr:mechanosensitive ion channel family protein [Saprospiraceae bacterium]
MTRFGEIFRQFYLDLSSMLPNIVVGIVVFILFVILGKLFYQIVGKRIQQRWKDTIVSSFVAESSKWAFYFLGAIIALHIFGFGGIASGVIAGAGVGALVFGFAFKDIGENFLAGILLAVNRPFEVGDIIEADGQKGTVRNLDLRSTHLRNAEGKDIFLPNAAIVKNTVINYTIDGNLRINFPIGIAPENDIEATRTIIMEYLEHSPFILQEPKPNVVVEELAEYTTNMRVLFWVDILANKTQADVLLGRTIRSKVITDVKALLDENGIEMPSQVLEHKMYRDHVFRVNE